ncbi:hypothetical protein BC834DRAFT_878481 [Gloeopeniophorella convolvens]|nr:hypothetical protein BC834DRAFT_878481 [Gloeopeniophorella convolvens]
MGLIALSARTVTRTRGLRADTGPGSLAVCFCALSYRLAAVSSAHDGGEGSAQNAYGAAGLSLGCANFVGRCCDINWHRTRRCCAAQPRVQQNHNVLVQRLFWHGYGYSYLLDKCGLRERDETSHKAADSCICIPHLRSRCPIYSAPLLRRRKRNTASGAARAKTMAKPGRTCTLDTDSFCLDPTPHPLS